MKQPQPDEIVYQVPAVISPAEAAALYVEAGWMEQPDEAEVSAMLKGTFAVSAAFHGSYRELGLHGLSLLSGGNIEAFAIFSPINSDSWTVHFEKARSDCKGAAQVINQRTAQYLLGKCEYINREQDLGIPGLRQAKQSYLPDRMLKDFLLIPK